VDIPHVDPKFQTNISGVYIAGELGGMGLIRNAIEQGRQAIESISKNGRKATNGQLDVVIVGAGPAGISAAMAAAEKGMSYRVMEQDTVGGTIAHYPRGKVVMTAPATLPIIGEFNFGETSKESLMEFWEDVVQRSGIKISTNIAVENVAVLDNGFRINDDENCVSSNILLAIGRRGTPRKLGVAGEECPKVVYRLVDPRQYRGQKVVVVGGGDSALEAALSLADENDVEVCLSYRGEAFNRVKAKNRERIAEAVELGKLRLEMGSQIQDISPTEISLKTAEGILKLANDAVIVCAGGILPTGFLRSIGVDVETRFGTVS
jgi:thioredoxin reductase